MQLGLWFYPENEKPQFQTQGQVQFRTDMTTGNGLGKQATAGRSPAGPIC